MLALPHGRRGDRRYRPVATDLHHGMSWQEGRKMGCHGDRTHARTAAAMRNRKRLVQVEMADIRADCRRARQPDLRVHVGAVHVHLTAVLRARSRRSRGCPPRTPRRWTDRSPSARPASRDAAPLWREDRRAECSPGCRRPRRQPVDQPSSRSPDSSRARTTESAPPSVAAPPIAVIGPDRHQAGEFTLRS